VGGGVCAKFSALEEVASPLARSSTGVDGRGEAQASMAAWNAALLRACCCGGDDGARSGGEGFSGTQHRHQPATVLIRFE
jgi:hypothetical protein